MEKECQDVDVLIIGAGAAGLMCAIVAGQRARRVLLIDHATKIGEKIRIAGGGRCNFTNLNTSPRAYLSQNPNFCTSALRRYTPQDFMALLDQHGISYHEKALGQMFCDHSALDVVHMLREEVARAGAEIWTGVSVTAAQKVETGGFVIETTQGTIRSESLVVACGGPSIPKLGASAFGYKIAEQFGLPIVSPRAGLVPLLFDEALRAELEDLAGVAVDPVVVTAASGQSFREALLFTHRGLSGPAILQISSYWQAGEDIEINLSPDLPVYPWLKDQRSKQAKSHMLTILATILPRRLAVWVLSNGEDGRIADFSDARLRDIARRIEAWHVKPVGSEGYRTAEVTVGGVDTRAISSKTFQANHVPGLYFIGEVLDVTGHLGGYNFQWAWSSGWCAGQYV